MKRRTLTVLTTVGSLRQARRIANAVLEQRLAACVHISPIESMYRWQGELQQEREFQLSIHTSASRARALRSALLALHPYELPAISILTPMQVHAPYASWVAEGSAATHRHRGLRSKAKGRTAHRARTGPRRREKPG